MRIYLLLVFFFCFIAGNCQSTIIIGTGFSVDVNRKPGGPEVFKNIPVSVQWSPFGFRKIFLVKFDYLAPLNSTGTDYAYTVNAALPAKIAVQKSVRTSLFSLSAGARIPVFKLRDRNMFYADILPSAICYQDIRVKYAEYDAANYEILNPDVNLHTTGVIISTGLVYRYLLNDKSSLLCMLHIQSPPLASAKAKGYELSYRLVAPLQLTIGYGFSYNNRKK